MRKRYSKMITLVFLDTGECVGFRILNFSSSGQVKPWRQHAREALKTIGAANRNSMARALFF